MGGLWGAVGGCGRAGTCSSFESSSEGSSPSRLTSPSVCPRQSWATGMSICGTTSSMKTNLSLSSRLEVWILSTLCRQFTTWYSIPWSFAAPACPSVSISAGMSAGHSRGKSDRAILPTTKQSWSETSGGSWDVQSAPTTASLRLAFSSCQQRRSSAAQPHGARCGRERRLRRR